MAVLVEAYSVVVRNSVLFQKYPGGWHSYRRDCPNNTFCADEHLSRIGFLDRRDVDVHVDRLTSLGFIFKDDRECKDIALVTDYSGLFYPCSWLEIGKHRDGFIVAWLSGLEPGPIAVPIGWSPGKSPRYINPEDVKEYFILVRRERDLDIYQDKRTGETFYVGRTT